MDESKACTDRFRKYNGEDEKYDDTERRELEGMIGNTAETTHRFSGEGYVT